MKLGNFNQDEIGKPTFEFVLEQGDFAYFPRGTIHQVSYRLFCR